MAVLFKFLVDFFVPKEPMFTQELFILEFYIHHTINEFRRPNMTYLIFPQ